MSLDHISIPVGLLASPAKMLGNQLLRELFHKKLDDSDSRHRHKVFQNRRFVSLSHELEAYLYFPDLFMKKYEIRPFVVFRSRTGKRVESAKLVLEFMTGRGTQQTVVEAFNIVGREIYVEIAGIPELEIQIVRGVPVANIWSVNIYHIQENAVVLKESRAFTHFDQLNDRYTLLLDEYWHLGGILEEAEDLLEKWSRSNVFHRLLSQIFYQDAIGNKKSRRNMIFWVLFWTRYLIQRAVLSRPMTKVGIDEAQPRRSR